MSDGTWPFSDPRLAGMREHVERFRMFLALARKADDAVVQFRFLMAGIYFARGIVELMFDAADKKQVRATRVEFKERLLRELPWYALIERIRIHDFHRFGVLPPNPKMKVLFGGGPMKLWARRGATVYSIPRTGPQAHVTGVSGGIEEQRPLVINDGKFFDDETQRYVSLEQILSDYLDAAPSLIEEFGKNMT